MPREGVAAGPSLRGASAARFGARRLGRRRVSLCSRRQGGRRGEDLGRCWARAKVGCEELPQGRAGRWELPVKDCRGARSPRCGGTSPGTARGAAAAPPRAGRVAMPAAGRKWEGFMVPPVGAGCEPALCGAPGADSENLVVGNKACLFSVSLLESAYGAKTNDKNDDQQLRSLS